MAQNDLSAEWQREAAYHRARAEQEARRAAEAASPEIHATHAMLAEQHKAMATSASLAAEMPDVAPLHSSRLPVAKILMSESYGDAARDDPATKAARPL